MLYNLRHVKEKTNQSKTNKHFVLCFIGNTLEKICNTFAYMLCYVI